MTPREKALEEALETMAPVPPEHPLRIAWDAYKQTEDFANTLKWATHPEHASGSLWASFEQGFRAALSLPASAGKESGEAVQQIEAAKAVLVRILATHKGKLGADYSHANTAIWQLAEAARTVRAMSPFPTPAELRERVAKALEPFAKAADALEPEAGVAIHDNVLLWQNPSLHRVGGNLTVGDLRRAREALAALPASAGEERPATAELRERVARELWNRFAPVHHLGWDDDAHKDEYRLAADAILALPELAGGVPAGWKLVPEEPTEEMVCAGDRKDPGSGFGSRSARIYRAMLAAAPPASGSAS